MISLIVPTRNRPDNIKRLYDSWLQTSSESELIIIADDDDVNDYSFHGVKVIRGIRQNAIEKINIGALNSKFDVIGFCGDDCVIESINWENEVLKAMTKPLSLVYVNDGVNKHTVPNHVFMTRKLYDTLGWFAHPDIVHCYADHVWRKIGQHLNKYNKGVFIKVDKAIFRHLHPNYNDKIEYDELYQQAYNLEQASIDKQTFLKYEVKI